MDSDTASDGNVSVEEELNLDGVVTGELDDLLTYHRQEINEEKVVPFLPIMLFRVGPKLTADSNKWFYALLNKKQLGELGQSVDDYKNGDPMKVVDESILDMTLEDMLKTYLFSPEIVPKNKELAYQETLSVVFGKGAETPVVRTNIEEGKRVAYNLRPSRDKANEVDLHRKVRDSLSYIRNQMNGQNYGAITVDLCYTIHGKGGD
jgi:hypothetical protein